MLLTTIRFDFNIQHPYRPLFDAMQNLGINQKEVKQVAWNFVNDWYMNKLFQYLSVPIFLRLQIGLILLLMFRLKTTLCLQYKPQYIAAGSLYLAAKLHNIKLPLHGAQVWWHQFDVAPKPLEGMFGGSYHHCTLYFLEHEKMCFCSCHSSNDGAYGCEKIDACSSQSG